MNFEISWLQSVENRLAAIWEAAPNRKSVIEAAYQIEQELKRKGERAGEPLSEGMRVLNIEPLRALFTVEGRIVEVVSIKTIETA